MSCCCHGNTNQKNMLLLACSGAANVGEIADRAARQLMAQGQGRMSCLAALGGDHVSMIEAAKKADARIVIDGCAEDCGRRVMERVGIADFRHVRVTDLGIEKVKGVWAKPEQVSLVVSHITARHAP